MNVAMLLEMVAEAAPDRAVVGAMPGALTAGELLKRSRRAAQIFAARDVEHVGLLDLNSDAMPIALFGAARFGRPFAPVNYRLPDDRLAAVVARLAPGLIIIGPDCVGRIPDIEGIQLITREEFLREVADDADDASESVADVDPDSIAVMLFTSGTTGDPKVAVLRHRHLASYIIESVEFLGAGDDEAQLVSVPPYHIAGVSAVLSSLYSGRRTVFLPSFDAAAWVDAVVGQRITQAMVVPTMLERILSTAERGGHALGSLRHLSYGGGRMPLEVIERAMTVMPHVEFVNAYGLTETSSTVSVLTPEDHRIAIASADPSVRARLRSVGRPVPAIELEVRDATGRPCAVAERGEIHVRGEQVAGEYLGGSRLTEDGWFPTQDSGYLDAEGYLYLEGRLDDVIVRGAENISPGEIEEHLMRHPAVVEAAVVGVPSCEWGEAVVAAVVVDARARVTEPELQRWVRDELRSTKTPEHIEFRPELPYSETGKLLRRVIRDELRELHGTSRS